ncbi:MAG: hypothetical protein Rubg2KO_14160 [Rubricoccaceae bacterium]
MPKHGAFDLDALPTDELARLATFASAERRRQFVLGRLAARRLVGHQLELPPQDVEIEMGRDGAPNVQSGFLSIAHGGRGLAAVGVAAQAQAPIGVDAETVRTRHPRLAARILRPDESDVLDALGGESASSLTLLWALKESVLKGQRTGLRAGAQSVRLSIQSFSESDGTAAAESDRSGVWRLSFTRHGDLWLAVALANPA